MFDCVWPTRTAVCLFSQSTITTNILQRFGNAITSTGTHNIRNAQFARDFNPIDNDCKCTTCRPRSEGGLGITRAYINHLTAKETVGAHLLSIHNVHYTLQLMGRARNAIIEDRYPDFVKEFFGKLYPNRDFPSWAITALAGVGIDL
jgi:tRNA-guanine family transglycosylase